MLQPKLNPKSIQIFKNSDKLTENFFKEKKTSRLELVTEMNKFHQQIKSSTVEVEHHSKQIKITLSPVSSSGTVIVKR